MFSLQKVCKKDILGFITLVFVFYAFLLPFLSTSFIAINEPDWIERSARFLEAFLKGDFANTYQKYHPGVTLMWIVGVCVKNFKGDIFSVNTFPQFAFLARFVLGTVFLLVILLSFNKLRKVFPLNWTFFVLPIFLFSEPFVMALVRSIGPDALLFAFVFACLCFFYSYLVERKRLDLILCGVFLGFALLTKVTAVFLFPFFVLGLIGVKSEILGSDPPRAGQTLKILCVILLTSALTFFLLFPAMWVNPLRTLKDIVTLGAIDAPLYDYASPIISEDLAKNIFAQKFLSYPLVFAFRSSPLFLIFFILGVLALFSKKLDKRLKTLGFVSLLFLVCYYIPISFAEKKIFKYALLFFVPATFFNFIGLTVLFQNIKRKWVTFAVLGVFAIQIIYNLSFVPNYLFYFNPLLGGAKVARHFVKIDLETTGFSMAGDYLNALGVGEDKIVVTYPPKSLGPFVNARVEDIRTYPDDADFLLVPFGKMDEFKSKITPSYVLEKTFTYRNLDYLFLYKNIYK